MGITESLCSAVVVGGGPAGSTAAPRAPTRARLAAFHALVALDARLHFVRPAGAPAPELEPLLVTGA